MDPQVRKASVANIDASRKAADGRRRILAGGLVMLGVAAALWLASRIFAGEPRWAGFLALAPLLARWALLIGAILLFLHFAVRKPSTSVIVPPEDPMAFGQTTTMFHDGEPDSAKRDAPPTRGPETEI